MSTTKVGVLHPGAMGASLIRALADASYPVFWCSHGRSQASRARADAAGAVACDSLSELVARCDILLSVCPPESALSLSQEIASLDFDGLFADLNAISPQLSLTISKAFPGRFVDGGIVGPPAVKPGSTRLYLSGPRAGEVKQLFAGTSLQAETLTGAVSSASALKMCYAAWSKGNAALLLSVRALAEALDVGDALEQEWSLSQAGTLERAQATATAVAPKAWRFRGEMDEIAATYTMAGLPDGFHAAASVLYGQLATFKDKPDVTLADVLAALEASRSETT